MRYLAAIVAAAWAGPAGSMVPVSSHVASLASIAAALPDPATAALISCGAGLLVGARRARATRRI